MIESVVVFFGAPGCGKGTQAKHLVAKYGFQHFSTGNLFREQVSLQTDLGKKVEKIMKSGGLIDDNDVNLVVKNKLQNSEISGNLLLDGYPRTVEQAEFLNNLLVNLPKNRFRVIQIDVDLDSLVQRISGRFVCSKCNATYGAFDKIEKCTVCGSSSFYKREDDKEDLVRDRVNKYLNVTAKVLDYYKDFGCITKVNGDVLPEEVSHSIDQVIECELNIVKKF